MKKQMLFKTKGMNQDLSVSAFNPEFSFENRNLRLSTNEGNTLLSWVNEKGTLKLVLMKMGSGGYVSANIDGYPIGTAVLNHKLVLFTTTNQSDEHISTGKPDNIYVLEYMGTQKTVMLVTELFNGNLNFSTYNPLETLVSYEADHIQKVYWTDNRNQPRMINIKGNSSKWESDGVLDFYFDFVPSLSFEEEVSVTKNINAGGVFAPGVIQYCFTYVNKHAQQSNIVYTSPLFYLSYEDRGASPEEKVTNSFTIVLKNINTKFDYVRLYSIQRTSLNADAYVRHVVDIKTQTGTITYIDNGTVGSTMDPTELLYVGGKEITALTMVDKDQTLFLGNVSQKNLVVNNIQDYFIKNKPTINFNYGTYGGSDASTDFKAIRFDESHGIYTNTNLMKQYNQRQITTFKGGEKYRFGFQLQKKTGEWTEPIWIGDKQNEKYPSVNWANDYAQLIYANADITIGSTSHIDPNIYKMIRPVVVFPEIGDRQVLCQGVLNPTVFNVEDRKSNSPFAQASWYFRPFIKNAETSSSGQLNDLFPSYVTPEEFNPQNPQSLIADEIFINSNHTTSVYVLVCDIDETWLGLMSGEHVLSATAYDGSTYSTDRHPFDKGVIRLNKTEPTTTGGLATYTCAFLSSTRWTAPFEDGPNGSFYKYHFMLHDILVDENNEEAYMLYDQMRQTDGFIYYVKDVGMGSEFDVFKFRFKTKDKYWIVVFNSPTSSTISNYIPDISGSGGSPVAYKHYESLYTEDNIDPTVYNVGDRTCIEIQGSTRKYVSALDNGSEENYELKNADGDPRRSNTQFFVDQSIVTLNSPDLEFDTEVQSYGVDKLELRIVGVIPITATVSAHSINAATAMIEMNHNVEAPSHVFGKGQLDTRAYYKNISLKAGNRLVSAALWNDSLIESAPNEEDKIATSNHLYDYIVYPWHRNGSLNNDFRSKEIASSWLDTKKESNLLFSINSEYITGTNYNNIDSKIVLTENDESLMNIRLDKQLTGDAFSDINYYPNVDKVLYNLEGYKPLTIVPYTGGEKVTTPVSMKYKSTTHAVISLKGTNNALSILPSYSGMNTSDIPNSGKPFWIKVKEGETVPTISFSNTPLAVPEDMKDFNYLWLGELHREVVNPFGGDDLSAIRSNKWLIGGETKSIPASGTVNLVWTEGDTYFQRYDCLKTYAYTPEDTNQVVEILSFMCETHVNIDGRWDRNRGQIDNTNMSPKNFGGIAHLNPAYSQRDNFFSYRKLNTDDDEKLSYPNQLTFTKTKTSGSDIDLWTNITMANTLELDGDKGEIKSLKRFNNQLLSFQDTGIAQILYNENVQISSTEGVPIELANSGKVQGKRYLSNSIGCSNKWSIAETPMGIYFMDSHDKNIYLFNGQLSNLSTTGGFNTWAKNNIPALSNKWTPDNFEDFVSYYDTLNQDVLWINKSEALAYSEKLGVFTSFYDYGSTPFFCTLDDTGIWVRNPFTNEEEETSITTPCTLWKNQAGKYCQFFDENKPYWMTLVGNPEPQVDKTFTNLEFRACVEGDGESNEQTGKFTPTLPFDSLETWNEYQHGETALKNLTGHVAMQHPNTGNSALKRKFRIWRCDIPRDNIIISVPETASEEDKAKAAANKLRDTALGVSRVKQHPVDRMRNPWLYLKLLKSEGTDKKTEIHDMMMTYFG